MVQSGQIPAALTLNMVDQLVFELGWAINSVQYMMLVLL